MLKYCFYDFLFNNYCLVLELNTTKIMTGSFFNENTIIFLNSQNKNDILRNFELFSQSQEDIIKDIFSDLNVVIISNFSSMLGLPYILSKYNITTENITFLSTEPIIQLSKSFMKEFYLNFNSYLILRSSNTLNQKLTLITPSDIDTYLALFTQLSFNQRFNSLIKIINPPISISLLSSGYELGSFNILLEYFNKKICILSHSSMIPNRYPLEFNNISLISIDYLIQFPNIINSTPQSSQYEKNINNFISDITIISSQSTVRSSHYPFIFLIAEPFFMFEFIDIIRYKLPKEVKLIYISKSIDSLIKYFNVNLSFINPKYYNKIYDFMLPFSFDDLLTKESFYSFETFEEMLSDEKISKIILKAECPLMFIVHKMSFANEENSINNLFQFFNNNASGGNDYILTLNYNLEKFPNTDINYKKYILDYNMTQEQYTTLINLLKPGNLHIIQNDNDIYGSNIDYEQLLVGIKSYSYEINKNNFLNLNHLFYSNSFCTSEIKESNDISLNCKIENVKLFFSKLKTNLTSEELFQFKNKSKDIIDQFEKTLKQYLECNEMTIIEFLYKQNMIKISVSNKLNESFSEIEITINNNEPVIDILTENYNNALYLNTLLSKMII